MDGLDRLARVAQRGLHAAAVMISGTAIEIAVIAQSLIANEQDRMLRALCANVQRDSSMESVEQEQGIGIALRRPDGSIIGALCAIDGPTRVWSDDDRALLVDLAALFEAEIELGAEVQRRRAAEEAGELVTRELAHRIKNIFTVIGSLVALSARGHPEARDFASQLGDRIAALGRANDFVRPDVGGSSHPETQSLLGLIEALMAPYQEAQRARIRIEGQDAPVGRSSVTTLALVLHELATNAVKYGALSSPSGLVTIKSASNLKCLTLSWQEQGGPEIQNPPEQKGFGTLLSHRAVAGQLGSTLYQEWRREGLVLRLEIPLHRLAQ
jgi:two-component sensor histidine kinase